MPTLTLKKNLSSKKMTQMLHPTQESWKNKSCHQFTFEFFTDNNSSEGKIQTQIFACDQSSSGKTKLNGQTLEYT